MHTETIHYDAIGHDYRNHRRPDPRIARAISDALGDARSVLNVGAGAGSYEPVDRDVTAVEPSAVMIAQRPPGAAPAVQASAESLPFADASFDACMAVLTMHHWSDRAAGLAEMLRVARSRVVILTWDVEHPDFWLYTDYFPDALDLDRSIFPPMDELRSALGGAIAASGVDVEILPVPHDCIDGFFGAYWRRPEMYLDPAVRSAISTFSRIDDVEPRIARLGEDIAGGRWAARNAGLLDREELDVGYRLVTLRRD